MGADGLPNAQLSALVAEVNRFYIRDRSLLAAQRRLSARSTEGRVDAREVAAYLSAARRYFARFHGDAQVRLREVAARLERANQEMLRAQGQGATPQRIEHVSQLQFNLTAELAIARARVARTAGMLEALAQYMQ